MSEQAHFPDITQDETALQQYYEEAVAKVRAGETVWMQREFESETGRVLDLYSEARHRGFIDEDYAYGCTPYRVTDDIDQTPVALTAEPVDFDTAVEMLRESTLV